jgi:hypothetical protein
VEYWKSTLPSAEPPCAAGSVSGPIAFTNSRNEPGQPCGQQQRRGPPLDPREATRLAGERERISAQIDDLTSTRDRLDSVIAAAGSLGADCPRSHPATADNAA